MHEDIARRLAAEIPDNQTCDWCSRLAKRGFGPATGATHHICSVHDAAPKLLESLERLAAEGGDVRLTDCCRFCGERAPGKHTSDCAWVQGRTAIHEAKGE